MGKFEGGLFSVVLWWVWSIRGSDDVSDDVSVEGQFIGELIGGSIRGYVRGRQGVH